MSSSGVQRVAEGDARPRPPAVLAAWAVIGLLLFAGLVWLGTWQLHRRVWKLDLIERVEQRVGAPAEPAPGREEWAQVTAASDEYRHVRVEGVFLHEYETLVQAVTEKGSGYWVLTPLRRANGEIILINRGFVPEELRDPGARQAGQVGGEVGVSGLLRISEPGGGFLRSNEPGSGRWYSRDVAAIAAAQRLPAGEVAPYFIDADNSPNPGGWPLGGLTVIRFHNSHLIYAITWYSLAAMVLGAAVAVARQERRLRRMARPSA
jgi:surfeit locus 1 family protein